MDGDINCNDMAQLCIDHKRRRRLLPSVEGDRPILKFLPLRYLLKDTLYCLAKATCKELDLYMWWPAVSHIQDMGMLEIQRAMLETPE
jgi:hypothetical protein